jgi:toxin ParE1/3/4
MNYRLIIKNRAERDLREQAEYLLRQGDVDQAVTFLAAAEETLAQLVKMPRIGKVSRWAGLALGEVRQWQMKDFRDYLIFYRLQETTLEVLRILRGSRDLVELLAELEDED